MGQFSLTSATNTFKRKFLKMSDAVFNTDNVAWARIKKESNFVGKDMFVSNPLSFSGGVGSGSLPTPNVANYEGSILNSKRIYATCEVEREAIKASATDEGAFVKAMQETVKKTLESFMRNNSRQLFSDGSGILGRGKGAGPADVTGAGSSGNPYIVTFAADTFKEANWEEKDLVQVVTGINAAPATDGGTAEATLLEVAEVVPATYQVKLVGTSARLAALVLAADPLAATDAIVMQGSYENDFTGLAKIKSFTQAATGSLYNVPYQRRWSMYIKSAGAAITTALMNDVMLSVQKRSGKIPNLIVAGFVQYQKLLELFESQKRYNVEPRAKEYKGLISFSGVEFMSVAGPVPVVFDRFVKDDEVWFLNDNYITLHMRPGAAQWFEEDGTIFLRKNSEDAYDARYGFYGEMYIIPSFHGLLTNLTT